MPHNRRKSNRVRTSQSVKIHIQVFPVMPFLGEAVVAELVNLSAGGMALAVADNRYGSALKKGRSLKIHVRVSDLAIAECEGVVTRSDVKAARHNVGVRFTHVPQSVLDTVARIAQIDTGLTSEPLELSFQSND